MQPAPPPAEPASPASPTRGGDPARAPRSPACRRPAPEHSVADRLGLECGEHACARARHRRPQPNCRSQARCCATSGWRRHTTASRSLRPGPRRKARILMGSEFRVNSGAAKIAAVDTASGRHEHHVPRRRAAPPPAAAPRRLRRSALRPNTNTGTSAPSARASSCRRARGQPQPPQAIERDQRGGGIGAAAAQPSAQRQALVQLDVGAGARAARRLQQARGAHGSGLARAPRPARRPARSIRPSSRRASASVSP